MTAVLFVGPSLPGADLADLEGITCLPPVAQGDFHKVALSQPRAIGIIDGYFHGMPAVWHKEILWAMAQGIHVFGAASMGALRAAELHAFGMRGIGQIFENFRDGVLSDDDEVAVLHGPAETGYLTMTEPMVNIRATLEQAQEQRVITPATRAEIEAIAKTQFYQERTWQTVLTAAQEAGPKGALAGLLDWLPDGQVDQKRTDALAMIAAMTAHLDADPGPMMVDYEFEQTEMWANAPWHGGTGYDQESNPDEDASAVLNELRLEGQPWFSAQERALPTAMACGEVVAEGTEPDRKVVIRELNAFRLEHGLRRRSHIESWARDHDTDVAGVEQMITERARLRELARACACNLNLRVLNQLRLSGDYARLAARAQHKADLLRERGAGGDAVPRPDRMIVEWYFMERLQRGVPENLDEYASDLGIPEADAFLHLLRCEDIYLMMLADKTGDE